MIESAVQLTGERISARDIHRIIEIGRATLQHPVEPVSYTHLDVYKRQWFTARAICRARLST